MLRRAFKLEGVNAEFELSAYTQVHLPRPFLHFDQLEDKTWRVIASDGALLFPLERLEVITLFGLGSVKVCESIWKGFGRIASIRSVVKLPIIEGRSPMIHFDEVRPGNWKLIIALPAEIDYKLTDISGLQFIRED